MQKVKKALRLLGLTALIILAMCGVGFFGALFHPSRDQANKPTTIERKDEHNENVNEEQGKE